METERDQGNVPCVAPVDGVPPRKPLVDEVPPGEQTAVQCDVGDPRKTTDVSHKRLSHYCSGSDSRPERCYIAVLSGGIFSAMCPLAHGS